jgi:phage terminase small subunit
MSKLRNWQHERFAQEIAAGTDRADAYRLAGYRQTSGASRNYNRLLRDPDIAARIGSLRGDRENRARAAGMSAAAVLAVFKAYGVERLDELFDKNAGGVIQARDLRQIPVEASIALLRFLREGLGVVSAP